MADQGLASEAEPSVGVEEQDASAVGWEPFELLAVGGAIVAIITIVGGVAYAILEVSAQGSTRTPLWTVVGREITLATAWSDYLAILLVVAVAVLWWEAHRWSVALEGEGVPEDDDDLDVVTDRPDPSDQNSATPVDVDANDEGFLMATGHLTRLRHLAAWLSVLLVVTAAAGVARLVGVLIEKSQFGDLHLAGTIVAATAVMLVALVVALVGLAVAHRTTLLCSWWDYLPELSLDDEPDGLPSDVPVE